MIGDLSLQHMPVGVATRIGPYLVQNKIDGILGLGFQKGNSSQIPLSYPSSLVLGRPCRNLSSLAPNEA